MQSVSTGALDSITRLFEMTSKEAKEDRRRIHHEAGTELLQLVRANVAGFRNTGKIAGWQQQYDGSGGGYTAVRAIKGETGKDSPGAITNYLENGHAIRRPKSTRRRYRARVRVPYVSGYHFYAKTRAQTERIARRAAEQLANSIAEKLGG